MIALHVPCLAQAHRPQLVRAMLQVGEKLGWDQTIPKGQTCCGLPAWEAGEVDAARAAARRLIAQFRDADRVLTPSPACLGMFRRLPQVLEGDALQADARALAEKTAGWCAFLLEQWPQVLPRVRFSGRVVWLKTCGADASDAWVEALAAVPQLTLVRSPVRCCSFSHDLSRRHPDLARAIAQTTAGPLQYVRADVVLVEEPGCLWRMAPIVKGKSQARWMHPAEWLAATWL